MSNEIRAAREARGWTSDQLNHELCRAAAELKIRIARPTSLRILISRWENGASSPDERYQRLLGRAFGLPLQALGFVDEGQAKAGVALPSAVQVRGTDVSGAMLDYFRQQHGQHARMDNVAGPGFVLGTVATQVEQLRRLAQQSPAEIVQVTARFAELAGWLCQDSGDHAGALRYTDESIDLAESAGDVALAAYNTMRKSNVLTSMREDQRAAVTARRAATMAEREAPDLLPVCLRQVAVSEAHLRREGPGREALDRALSLVDGGAGGHPYSAYCTTTYLEMEGALCSLVLGNPGAAVDACQRALDGWPVGLNRDQALCLTRLAAAHLEQHDLDEACRAALRAVELVAQAPSARTLHMLRVIGRRVMPLKDAKAVRELREALATVA
ncbi:putative sporulation-associated protein [Pseudonocardia dioxanivorans CB1190]|uniref:Sporulation-associated protein n=1 Tax=Pseudonocardia dioxanivorans (strain ATCC 55486 / DSM 44775 / JCM 13855 / CB1190) TaxID=675635 RepID=F4CTD4_PSEUX|nr:helix-turn-helix transcriptional regulator [Pseudonocardia dioxanivorans]AEA27359.1 putative sporulation-associated protein [Pseudonocardia dioxanivorans CB1190]